jgi:hypothetical protein
MRESTKELPVATEAPGMTVRNVIWGETAIGCLEQVSEHVARVSGQSS